MKILIVVNDAPYGTEKAYNALRLANQLGKEHKETEVRIFLMADAVFCAITGQKTPEGYYNIERFLKGAIKKGAEVKLCGTCADARGLKNMTLIEGTEISTLAAFTNLVVDSDKVISF